MIYFNHNVNDSQEQLINQINKITGAREQNTETNAPPEYKDAADKVNLSAKAIEMAKELEEHKAAIDQLPDIRTEKVEALSKAVNEGTYKINPYKVALKLLDETL
ncbi:Anti-sigma-28 factor, FlgM [Candidatus Magnetoovum chiemensis]|nr:Anti-sigma-28 factor, FlgM [Candidatus Magnetoovum chiemensis]